MDGPTVRLQQLDVGGLRTNARLANSVGRWTARQSAGGDGGVADVISVSVGSRGRCNQITESFVRSSVRAGRVSGPTRRREPFTDTEAAVAGRPTPPAAMVYTAESPRLGAARRGAQLNEDRWSIGGTRGYSARL